VEASSVFAGLPSSSTVTVGNTSSVAGAVVAC
jgi:hypothetical protein